MKIYKYNEFKKINEVKYTEDDIVACIKAGGYIITDIVKDLPKHKQEEPIYPVNVENNQIEAEIKGKIYYINTEDVLNIYI